MRVLFRNCSWARNHSLDNQGNEAGVGRRDSGSHGPSMIAGVVEERPFQGRVCSAAHPAFRPSGATVGLKPDTSSMRDAALKRRSSTLLSKFLRDETLGAPRSSEPRADA